MILDGYGDSNSVQGNAVAAANTPNLDRIWADNPHAHLSCSGLSVGLPEGQMGNSEVGHLNLGAGRIVYQELTRISKSIDDGDFFENEAFLKAVKNVKENNSALHIMGLVSDGGVHSFDKHYIALLELANRNGLDKVYVHCFMDGRDTPPSSGLDYIKALEDKISEIGVGQIASVHGRYYAMDRDKRYERIQLTYDALTLGKGETATSAQEAMEKAYADNITDEFVLPTVMVTDKGPVATINDNDSVIFFNFRPDRARQLTRALTEKDFAEFNREKFPRLTYITMTQYDATLTNVTIAFKPQVIVNTLGEYLSNHKKKQLRIAETEKYAHVTYFFNGGVEKEYPYEERALIPSPKVATYDLQPEMSAYLVTERLEKEIKEKDYNFIAVNYANCDMVGHTGVFEAAVKAVEAVDECVGRIVDVAKEKGYSILITADHGNAEKMLADDGEAFTAHTTNKVKLIVIDKDIQNVKDGKLADVAPTVLNLMGMDIPEEMSGDVLV